MDRHDHAGHDPFKAADQGLTPGEACTLIHHLVLHPRSCSMYPQH